MKILIGLVVLVAVLTFVWNSILGESEENPKAIGGLDVITGIRSLDIKTRLLDPDLAIDKAKVHYRAKIAAEEDISNGPCLADELFKGWVADLVHNPRLPIDDLPENQCPSYVSGKNIHFVELDLSGNVVRVY